ncbi:MAG: RES family NAD+ phosphorylase [Rhodospirillales bacterium]|nr:RES family NAD+ phosphorylase [Rhodospirillales bacterium]
MFFGPGASEPPAGRFDATNGSFRTCYAGMTPEACFAEKFLRLGERTIEESFLQKIALARIELLQPLTLVALHGQGLSSVSATASAVNGPYASSRLWSAALHAHPQRPDGLCWRSRFDDSLFCVALFDRCRAHLRVAESVALVERPALLMAMSQRWGLALID